jgi:hypothetical protein
LRGNWNTDPGKGVHEILYWTKKGAPRSDPPENPASDPQFAFWEYPVQLWAAANSEKIAPVTPSPSFPKSTLASGFTITSPQSGISVPSFAPIVISVAHPNMESVRKVSYYLNTAFIGSSMQAPFTISTFPASHGPTILRAVAESSRGNEEKTITFTIQ